VFIDDATGQLGELWFTPAETFFAYCAATRHYLERCGKPVAFYSDKHGVFRVNQPRPLATTPGLTQFGRAMQELDIQIICADRPQAKGRVERANQTLQDRLVKELRLRDICDLAAGNAYLPEFREDFNRRFAVQPRSQHDAHRPLAPSENLDRILTHQETRTLSKNLTVQFKQVICQVQSERPGYALRNAQVKVCENAQGEVTLLYKTQTLAHSLYLPPAPQAQVVDSKSLDHHLNIANPPHATIPGVSMVITSTAPPSRSPPCLAPTDASRRASLALWAKNWAAHQEQREPRSAQSLASGRRSGSLSSVAPILRTSGNSGPHLFIHPGQRGQFYFVKKGTFLFWVDMLCRGPSRAFRKVA